MKSFVKYVPIVSFTLLFSSCCEWFGTCDELPDLMVPEYITGQAYVGYDPRMVFLGNQPYPNGTDIFIYNTRNEFFSVLRTNPATGQTVVFYWSHHDYPPFGYNAPAPFYPLQPGEVINVHRFVWNNSNSVATPNQSKTRMEVKVRVENGSIVETIDEQQKITSTPTLGPNEYVVQTFPVQLNSMGNYEFTFIANDGNLVEEENYNNNTLEDYYNDNLATD